jgi:hypothetical protein
MPLDKEPTKYTDIVIDLETWSLRPTAAIRSIGAVAFNIAQPRDIPFRYAAFYTNIYDPFGHRDLSTEQWWARQGAEAQAAFNQTKFDLYEGLERFVEHITAFADKDTVRVWSNGAGFDLPILRSACGHLKDRLGIAIELPWSYKNERDTRTLYWLAGGVPYGHMSGVKHHALDDALYEAARLNNAWHKLNDRHADIAIVPNNNAI